MRQSRYKHHAHKINACRHWWFAARGRVNVDDARQCGRLILRHKASERTTERERERERERESSQRCRQTTSGRGDSFTHTGSSATEQSVDASAAVQWRQPPCSLDGSCGPPAAYSSLSRNLTGREGQGGGKTQRSAVSCHDTTRTATNQRSNPQFGDALQH